MLIFPIDELLDEQRCYEFLLHMLHPAGLQCPQGHPLPPAQRPHDRHRAPVVDYRCRQCGAVYNLFTGTCWRKTRDSCGTLVLLLRGMAQGVPTKHLAEELHLDRSPVLERRHAGPQLLEQRLPPYPPPRPHDRSG